MRCVVLLVAMLSGIGMDDWASRHPKVCLEARLADERLLLKAGLKSEAASIWSLAWDDVIDGRVEGQGRACLLRLSFDGSHVTGSFAGHVFGESRNDRFSGEMLGGDYGHVLVLRQTEDDYVSCYQASLEPDGTFKGVWHDSVGRSGDFRLERRRTPV